MENLIFKHFFGLTPRYFTCPFCGNKHDMSSDDISLYSYLNQNYLRCPSFDKAISLDVVGNDDDQLELSFDSSDDCPSLEDCYSDIAKCKIDPTNRRITYTFSPIPYSFYSCKGCSRKYSCPFFTAFESESTIEISFDFYANAFQKAYKNYLADCPEADTEKLLKDKDAKIKGQEIAIQERDAKIKSQEELIQSQNATIDAQAKTIQEQEASICLLQTIVDDQDETLRQYKEEKIMSEPITTDLAPVNPAVPAATAAPALPINFEEISKQLGINFGILKDDRICSTVLGTAVKCSDGTYHVYDKSRNVVRSYADLATVKLPSITVPLPSVKVGNNILHGNNFYCVSKVESNSVVGTNLSDMTQVASSLRKILWVCPATPA